ncbi:MAG: hypothetical protein DLM69_08470 [Candidatus Chloroheliales bacterium]|nr:MAG: hypothetical protein DLM69_08470 [Chloroflexota bacterium]
MMRELYQRTVIGDKGYISKPLQQELAAQAVALLTPSRRNQKQQLPKAAAKRLNGARQIVETVNSQLAEQFHIERNHASSFRGLVARLYSKLAAHTLCIKLNRLLGNPDFLHIKELAYPG